MLGERAIVLLSGGIDSTTSLFWAKKNFKDIKAISFVYGQKHEIEIKLAKYITKSLGVEHFIFDLSPLAILFSTSSLVNKNLKVPHIRYEEVKGEVISTYVPLRNTIFCVLAGVLMEQFDIQDLVIGIHSLDAGNYPDCRAEWVTAMENLLTTGSKFSFENKRVRIHTPLINLKKHEIIMIGKELGVNFEYTWSCYEPVIKERFVEPCGKCPSCLARREAFKKAGFEDPLKKIPISFLDSIE